AADRQCSGDRLAKVAIVVSNEQAWRDERHDGRLDWQATAGGFPRCKLGAGSQGLLSDAAQAIAKAVLLSNVAILAKSNVWKRNPATAKLDDGLFRLSG